jgi:hypothetical protein
MADGTEHTFQFRVSGLNLNDEVKQRISSEFAAAATRILVAENPDIVHGEMYTRCRINGGRNIILRDAARLTEIVAREDPTLLEYEAVVDE